MLILRYGTDVDHQDQEGLTALMKCCRLDELRTAYALAKLLIECGANAGLADIRGRHALYHAVIHRRPRLARLFLMTGDLNINQKDCCGDTVLHVAARKGQDDIAMAIVRYMLRYEVTVDVRDAEGLTPLMRACQAGHLQTARMLAMEGKASLTMRDNKCHKTAQEWLETLFIVPTGMDPFHCNHNVLQQCHRILPQKVQRVRSATVRRSKAVTSDLNGQTKRASSAPGRRRPQNQESVSADKPRIHHNNSWVDLQVNNSASRTDSRGEHIHQTSAHLEQPESYVNQFIPLYQVYSIQSSPSYRPPARKPSPPPPTPEPPPTPKSPKSPKLNARNKLQKFLRMKRAESIVKAFTGKQQRSMSVHVTNGQQKNPFQHAVFATLRRRSTKSETIDSSLMSPDLKEKFSGRRGSRARPFMRVDSSESMCSSSGQSSPQLEQVPEGGFAEGVKKLVRMRKMGMEILKPPLHQRID